jgi:hypothetical protein
VRVCMLAWLVVQSCFSRLAQIDLRQYLVMPLRSSARLACVAAAAGCVQADRQADDGSSSQGSDADDRAGSSSSSGSAAPAQDHIARRARQPRLRPRPGRTAIAVKDCAAEAEVSARERELLNQQAVAEAFRCATHASRSALRSDAAAELLCSHGMQFSAGPSLLRY